MADYIFGLKQGTPSPTVRRIAKEQGAQVVEYTDPECKCGHGCKPYRCKLSRRYWLTVEQTGIGEQHARQVRAAIIAAEPEWGDSF